MAGKFIVSLDCEGMWGMADQPHQSRQFVTQKNLADVYQKLIDLFAEYEIPATFAFVGMFVLNEKERQYFEPKLGALPYRGQDWLTNFKKARAEEKLDGWFFAEALDMVNSTKVHEIGTHGFTHIPFDGPDTPKSLYEQELSLVSELGKMKQVSFNTIVFPRNRLGHLDLMDQFGVKGYRELLKSGGPALRLLRELNVFEKSQTPQDSSDSPVRIPSGYFLNWRHGGRKRIPQAVTIARWNSILGDAAKKSGVAHLWTHPHNFISAPSTFSVLEQIIKKVAQLRDSQALQVQTQQDYVAAQLATELN
ncbi:MAG: hypothetical protein AAF623_05550 [Planctomycetota bacterium]